ncbi:MAG: hypothetical protein AB1512_06705 [Thermodesulfobacteriota bacterium]
MNLRTQPKDPVFSHSRPGIIPEALKLTDPARPGEGRFFEYFVSWLASMAILGAFYVLCPQCRHWCLFPLWLCGTLAGRDLVGCIGKRMDYFDPKVMISAFLYLNTFLAPMIHISTSLYGRELTLDDWATEFGYLSCFNGAGILLLNLAQGISFGLTGPTRRHWEVVSTRFFPLLAAAFVASVGASAVIWVFFGGLVKASGRVAFHEEAFAYAGQLSWLRMIGDPAVTLLFIGLIVFLYRRRPGAVRSLPTLIAVIAAATILQFLLVGARGSRSAVLNGVFLVTVMAHLHLRPLSWRVVAAGFAMAFVFLNLYDYRKKMGTEGWQAFHGKEARERLEKKYGEITFTGTLLGDLSRADVQAFLLHNLRHGERDHEYLYGESYLMAFLTFIPRGIWAGKPKSPKLEAGTELQGVKREGVSTRQYGLAGESMLNFGLYGVLPSFLALGAILGWFRKKAATLRAGDSRNLLLPIAILVFAFSINADSDKLFFMGLREGFLPFLVIFLGSTGRVIRSAQRTTESIPTAPSPTGPAMASCPYSHKLLEKRTPRCLTRRVRTSLDRMPLLLFTLLFLGMMAQGCEVHAAGKEDKGFPFLFTGGYHPGREKWHGPFHDRILHPWICIYTSAPDASQYEKAVQKQRANGVAFIGYYYSACTSYLPSSETMHGRYPERAMPPSEVRPEWVLRDGTGEIVTWNTRKDRWFLDIGRQDVQEAILERAIGNAVRCGTDGLSLDNWTYKYWAPPGQTIPQWTEKSLSLLKRARERTARQKMRLIVNQSSPPECWHEFAPFLDGIGYEMGAHPGRLVSRAAYERELSSNEQILKLGKSLFLYTDIIKEGNRRWDEDGRKAAMTALLVVPDDQPRWGGIYVCLPRYEVWPSGGWAMWPEQLGRPLGPRAWHGDGVVRRFERGVIRVTPGASAGFSIETLF